MKKEISNGVIYIESEKEQKYINAFNAIAAAQYAELCFAMQGYLVASEYSHDTGRAEVTVYFEGKPFPKIKQGVNPTKKTIRSHQYWQESTKSMVRIRCMELRFEF